MTSATSSPRPAVRIGNCSGFYGDRASAMREMLEASATGPRLDYLTGDYLAELTMLILGRDLMKDPATGYAKTFLRQLSDGLALAREQGVRIVANAGGLNPAALAAAIDALGTSAAVAYVDGDDVRSVVDVPDALTANAYQGAFGIARALQAGADVVVTGRVTDASLVLGPAIARFGWKPSDLDELAGAVVAGHVIECGTQATGGNFAGFATMLAAGRGTRPLGFPVAEVAADGSSVITKYAGTGGLVTVDTVTAQLLYEVQGPLYLGPDVTVDLTSIRLEQQGADRVAIDGVAGVAPPERLKVGVNVLGGLRNQMEFVLTGLDIDAKAAWLRGQLEASLPQGPSYEWSSYRLPAPDSSTEEGAACLLRLSARSGDADLVGRAFTAPAIELALASYPGFHVTAPPGRPTPYGIFRTTYVDRALAREVVHLPDGTVEVIDAPAHQDSSGARPAVASPRATTARTTRRAPLGGVVYARSGDKGGDANVGLWIPQSRSDAAVDWLLASVTPGWIRALLPEAVELEVDVTPLPNLRGVNVVIHGLLGEGVAASTRFDPQAKAVGEWLRSRVVEIPEELL